MDILKFNFLFSVKPFRLRKLLDLLGKVVSFYLQTVPPNNLIEYRKRILSNTIDKQTPKKQNSYDNSVL